MLCQCLLLGAGPGVPKAGPSGRGRPAPAGGLAGGGALLETAGLGWRRWVSGDWWRQLPSPRLRWPSSCPGLHTLLPGAESLGRICSYLTVLVLAACLGLLSMLGLWRDRVREWEGADRGGGVQRHFPGDWIPLCKLVRPRGAGLCVGGLRQWSGGGWSGPWRGRRRS